MRVNRYIFIYVAEVMYDIARRHIANELRPTTVEETKRLIAAVLTASQEFPDYFIEHPKSNVEHCKREAFLLCVKINYYEHQISSVCMERLKRDLHDVCARLANLRNPDLQKKRNISSVRKD